MYKIQDLLFYIMLGSAGVGSVTAHIAEDLGVKGIGRDLCWVTVSLCGVSIFCMIVISVLIELRNHGYLEDEYSPF